MAPTQSVLLSGGSGALGASVLRRLQRAEFAIHAPASSPKSIAELMQAGASATQVDLTDEAAVKRYVSTLPATGDLRAAVLLAGGFAMGSLTETSSADLRKMLAINFETAFHLVRELLPVFERRGGGQFVLVGARPALNADAGAHMAAYALSKGLVHQLAELINAHGHGKRIDATLIVPSVIDTPANRAAMPDADPGKWVSPDAIAETIAFVLSDAGRQMRGSVLKLYNES